MFTVLLTQFKAKAIIKWKADLDKETELILEMHIAYVNSLYKSTWFDTVRKKNEDNDSTCSYVIARKTDADRIPTYRRSETVLFSS